jgi:hypothetical protein
MGLAFCGSDFWFALTRADVCYGCFCGLDVIGLRPLVLDSRIYLGDLRQC